MGLLGADWGMVTKEQRDKVKGSGEEKDKREENREESEEKVWERKSKHFHFQCRGIQTVGSKQCSLNNLYHVILIKNTHPCVTS